MFVILLFFLVKFVVSTDNVTCIIYSSEIDIDDFLNYTINKRQEFPKITLNSSILYPCNFTEYENPVFLITDFFDLEVYWKYFKIGHGNITIKKIDTFFEMLNYLYEPISATEKKIRICKSLLNYTVEGSLIEEYVGDFGDQLNFILHVMCSAVMKLLKPKNNFVSKQHAITNLTAITNGSNALLNFIQYRNRSYNKTEAVIRSRTMTNYVTNAITNNVAFSFLRTFGNATYETYHGKRANPLTIIKNKLATAHYNFFMNQSISDNPIGPLLRTLLLTIPYELYKSINVSRISAFVNNNNDINPIVTEVDNETLCIPNDTMINNTQYFNIYIYLDYRNYLPRYATFKSFKVGENTFDLNIPNNYISKFLYVGLYSWKYTKFADTLGNLLSIDIYEEPDVCNGKLPPFYVVDPVTCNQTDFTHYLPFRESYPECDTEKVLNLQICEPLSFFVVIDAIFMLPKYYLSKWLQPVFCQSVFFNWFLFRLMVFDPTSCTFDESKSRYKGICDFVIFIALLPFEILILVGLIYWAYKFIIGIIPDFRTWYTNVKVSKVSDDLDDTTNEIDKMKNNNLNARIDKMNKNIELIDVKK